jgi:hypothetical protein
MSWRMPVASARIACGADWPRRPRNGTSERAIMRQTGHRSVQMVRRYIRQGELFIDNAAAKLGL